LASAGVANSVQQVQELEQAIHSGFISIQDKQDEQDAVNTRQEAINASARSTTGGDSMDDNATAFSALTASSAVKDRRIIDLELQLRCANTNPTPPPTGGGSAFPWRGGGGNSRSGGRGGGRGGGRSGGRGGGACQGYCSRADGPKTMTKSSKYWNSDT
jgi:hypothetical protein